jgi:putative aldouronate transport system permease protein
MSHSISHGMVTNEKRALKRESFFQNISHHYILYLMVIPGLVFFVFIRFVPTAGSIIAWQKFSIFRGIFHSQWVGWRNFQELFAYYDFYRIFGNTLTIGLYRIIFGFPVPIILALLMNEVAHKGFKKVIQSSVYIPYFLSWVVVAQLFYSILHPSSGIVNIFLHKTLGIESIFFLGKDKLFQPIVTVAYIWKYSGYYSIVYLAALASVDPQLYEAATIDGANRWQQLWAVTLPSLLPIMVIMLLLSIGRFMEIGFDQIYNLLNPLVLSTGDIFDTYVYRVGLQEGRYSLTTAVGLFKAVIGVILISGGNALAKKLTGEGFFK